MGASWPMSGGKKFIKNRFHFWSSFGVGFGAKMAPKMVPKSIQNLSKNCLKICNVFYNILGGLGALQVPLGSLLGLPEPLLGGLWTPKTLKNCEVLKVFANATFWVFGALDGPLGPICGPLLEPILAPKWPPKMVPKLVQKLTISGPIFGSLFCWVLELFGSLLGASWAS